MTKREINTASALAAYFKETPLACAPYGNGLINDTFLVITEQKRYILQRINKTVFPRPDRVMENIVAVTEHIRQKVKADGGDAERCTLQVLDTLDGKKYFVDAEEQFWRLYAFAESTVTLEQVENAKQFYSCGRAFGAFQSQLADFPASTLHEPLAGLHDTPDRLRKLRTAMERNVCGRAEGVKSEFDTLCAYEGFYSVMERAELPLRVTHNDTKLNNILFDEKTGQAVLVIDLDTVMPGYSVTDFGDAIRAGAAKDGTLDLSLFEVFAEGFLQGCEGRLTERELELLPDSALLITLELSMRFLADYLNGDTYFRVHREGHNLDRARNQFKLVSDMESRLDEMRAIVKKYS